jgi:hypothetical protein
MYSRFLCHTCLEGQAWARRFWWVLVSWCLGCSCTTFPRIQLIKWRTTNSKPESHTRTAVKFGAHWYSIRNSFHWLPAAQICTYSCRWVRRLLCTEIIYTWEIIIPARHWVVSTCSRLWMALVENFCMTMRRGLWYRQRRGGMLTGRGWLLHPPICVLCAQFLHMYYCYVQSHCCYRTLHLSRRKRPS